MTTQLMSGYAATEVEGELAEKVKKFFAKRKTGCIRLEPQGWFLPKPFLKYADRLYAFKFRTDDVVLMTWPKSGTRWIQEIVWTMRNNPDFDNPAAKTSFHLRCPYMDFDMLVPPSHFEQGAPFHALAEDFVKQHPGRRLEDGLFLQLAETIESPRTVKTHLPFSFVNPELLEKAKTVVVVRNPKDVCVSYHHHCRLTGLLGFCGSLDDFVDFFVNDELNYSPYWTFLREVFKQRDHPNVHLIFFEELKANPFGEMQRLDAFLGTGLTDDQISKIVEYTKFETMKEREVSHTNPKRLGFDEEVFKNDGGFLRKGEVGNYKEKLTPEQEAKIDAWTQKNSGGLHTELKYSM